MRRPLGNTIAAGPSAPAPFRLPIRFVLPIALVFLLLHPSSAAADAHAVGGHGAAVTLLWVAILLLAAKLSGMVESFGQPGVLGELLIGVVLGNLVLVGIDAFEPITSDPVLRFLAELGVVVLLFQIGLESNLAQMGKVGVRALLVALIGVVLPFALGTLVVGPWLMPGLELTSYLFIGAALTATSVGITARVFRDLGMLRSKEAQIVLGAAVIDDVLGLVILAVVSAIVTAGSISVGTVGVILLKALLFLVGAVLLGQLLAPGLGRLFSRVHKGAGMKLALALSFALVFAFLAGLIGLAPIVGAFAAGLVLDPVHFHDFDEPELVREIRGHLDEMEPPLRARLTSTIALHSHRHVEDLLEPIGYLLVPIFFVLTGMSVDLRAMLDLPVLLVALGLTAAAILGKALAGLAAGDVNRTVVGVGMVPRGEVGLIFATMGRQLGVLPERVFGVVVIMVILTTLLTPPVLSALLKRQAREQEVRVPAVAAARMPALQGSSTVSPGVG